MLIMGHLELPLAMISDSGQKEIAAGMVMARAMR